MSNLVVRTISGSIFVALIVSSILLHPFFFAIVFSIVCSMALMEFYSINNIGKYTKICGVVCGTVLFILSFLALKFGIYSILLAYPALVIIYFVSTLFSKSNNSILEWSLFVLGQAFVAIPLSCMNIIYFSDSQYGKYLLLALFVIIWTNDTGAYCVGSLLGKHKMIPRVSPGKSWEGLIGGLCFALIAGWIFSIYIGVCDTNGANLIYWMIFALVVSTFGTFGDLIESLMKRTLGIKDSGNVIPGHGGMLDRFDSVLLAAPCVTIYILLLS